MREENVGESATGERENDMKSIGLQRVREKEQNPSTSDSGDAPLPRTLCGISHTRAHRIYVL